MWRSSRLPSLVVVLALGLSGSGTALERDAKPVPIRGRSVKATRTGLVDLEKGAARDRMMRLLGREATPVVVHAPLPVPEMPVPPGWGPPAAFEETPAEESPATPQFDLPQAPLPLPAGVGFAGLGDINTSIPPDTHGAVGPTKVMTTLNTQVLVQTRAGAIFSGPLSLNVGFWGGIATNLNVFLPRVHFDPDPAYGGRWIWVASQASRNNAAGILVAASTGPEPLRGPGAFFDADASNNVWADASNVGFNRHWVVVQVNMFSMTNPYPFVRSNIYVFRKDQLYAGTVSAVAVFSLGSTSCEGSTCGGSQVPALTYDFTQNDLYLVQRWSSGAGALRLYRIAGPVNAPTITPLLPLVFGPPWADSEPTGPGADFGPQPAACGGMKIQTNDSRIQNVIWRNGRLWTTHTVFLPQSSPNRASVQWWQIQTDSTVVQRGLVDGGSPARFYAFPSIAVNQNEDVLLGFSSFATNEFASAQYTFRLASDAPNTMQQPVVLKAGEDCYDKDYTTGRVRWGDYSATVVDPTDDTSLWTIQEYAETAAGPLRDDSRWGTWWGMVEPPSISIADASVAEGNAGTTLLTFDLALSVQVSDTVTVQWATANDSATDVDDDYVPASGTVTFPPLATTATLQVPVKGDVRNEADERFFVNLSSPQYATIADPQAVGTILNDDVPQVSIGDVVLVEGSGGPGSPTSFVFPVTLSNPSDTNVTVSWATGNGTAAAGAFGTGDFVGVGPTLLTFAPGVVDRTVTVQVHADSLIESDEVFYVDLTSPSGATVVRSRGVGRIEDDDAPYPRGVEPQHPRRLRGLRLVERPQPAAVDQPVRHSPGAHRVQRRRVVLAPAEPRVRHVAGRHRGDPGRNEYPHNGLTLDRQYCYSLWLDYGGGNYSPRASLSARPFDSTPPNKVRWKLSTGTSLMAAPTVGQDAVVAVSNDMSVQALQRDPASGTGGLWPGGWKPAELGSLAQHRLPVVPLGGGSRAFIATQDGRIHAIDTASGNLIWSTLLPEGAAMGAPAGIFTAFGGAYDYVLVGTSALTDNHFYALHPDTGAVIDAFPGPADGAMGSVGAILGTSTVDYAASRVYFASRRSGANRSLWCLELGPSSDALRLGWSRDLGFDVDGSPVLRGGRLYVVDNSAAHAAWSVPADTGLGGYSRNLGASASKGFPFPDRRSGDLYVATDTTVNGLTDTGAALNDKWTPIPLDQPSIVLLRPGTNDLYVGVRNYSGNASILRIDTASGTVADNVPLETSQLVVGAPSLDIGYDVIHVGSELGILYSVQLPF